VFALGDSTVSTAGLVDGDLVGQLVEQAQQPHRRWSSVGLQGGSRAGVTLPTTSPANVCSGYVDLERRQQLATARHRAELHGRDRR